MCDRKDVLEAHLWMVDQSRSKLSADTAEYKTIMDCWFKSTFLLCEYSKSLLISLKNNDGYLHFKKPMHYVLNFKCQNKP